MRVFFDGFVFEKRKQFGIWRYFYEVLRRAPRTADLTLWLRAHSALPLPPGARIVADSARQVVRPWDVSARLRRKYSNYRIPAELNGAAVFHSTYYTPCPKDGPAVVVTVYDMIAERMYSSEGGGASDAEQKGAAIRQASLCLAISQATADDLVAFYPECKGRVRVTHLGADHLEGPGPRKQRPALSDESFALFVGDRHGYKNFPVVLDALTQSAWPRHLRLHVVGPPLAPHERRLLEVRGLSDRIQSFGRVTEAELRNQYARAQCFIYPSLLEGFGLPVLEAQINGCPAVLSDTPVFREVAGDAAVFFDPRLGERLAESVATACEPEVYKRLSEAGADNVRRFRWDQTAEQTFAAYEAAAA